MLEFFSKFWLHILPKKSPLIGVFYFYDSKSGKWHSPEKQHFPSVSALYNVWGCFSPPFRSHSVNRNATFQELSSVSCSPPMARNSHLSVPPNCGLFLTIGNESKYQRSEPSCQAFEHVAYLESASETFCVEFYIANFCWR